MHAQAQAQHWFMHAQALKLSLILNTSDKDPLESPFSSNVWDLEERLQVFHEDIA